MKTRTITKFINNNEVYITTVTTDSNFKVELLSYGATINKIMLDDKILNVTPLNLKHHFNNGAKFGKTIGRYAGRIEDAKFTLKDKSYQLKCNNGTNCLHGGVNQIAEKNFDTKVKTYDNYVSVIYTLFDKEVEFPGDVLFEIIYNITNDLEIEIIYKAYSNQDTIINLTNHTYFNLSGDLSSNILNHDLYINSSNFTDLKENMCTREVKQVSNIMDFKKEHKIGLYIEDDYLQNHPTKGYDHCFFLDERNYDTIACSLKSSEGYYLDVYTTYPTVVIYTANYPERFKVYPNKYPEKYEGICFECQYRPNSINYSNETVLLAGDEYLEKTKFKFGRLKEND